MRILFVCEFGSLNGGEHSLLSILPHLKRLGCQPIVAAPADSDFAQRLQDAGIEWREIQFHDSIAGGRRGIDDIHQQIMDLADKSQADIVHANSLSVARVLGPLSNQLNAATVGHIRDIIKPSKKALGDLALNDFLVTVSDAATHWFNDLGIPRGKLVRVYNGIDTDTFFPAPPTGYLHDELSLSDNVPLLLSVGQIGIRKGLDTAIAGIGNFLGSISAGHSQPHWLIVGQRHSTKQEALEFEQALHAHASRPPLKGVVHFLGRRNDIPRVMRECTLLVHAARQEPLGRVLLEAAASGLAAVASNVGGTKEIFCDEKDALLFDADDVEQLTRWLTTAMHDQQLRESLASHALARIRKDFVVESAAEATWRVYCSLLN